MSNEAIGYLGMLAGLEAKGLKARNFHKRIRQLVEDVKA